MAKKKQQTVYSFGSSYRCAREKREYTREQVAERANISPRFLSAIENDRRKPSLNVLIRLVLAIGASFDEILAPSAVSDEEVTDRIKRLITQWLLNNLHRMRWYVAFLSCVPPMPFVPVKKTYWFLFITASYRWTASS